MDTATLLSIKQFSELTGVPTSTLRYYDKIGLFYPAEKGDDNNYRYYVPFQCITINFIKVLVNLGVPLAQIKKLASERTPEELLTLFIEQEEILDAEMRSLQNSYSVIHRFRKNLENGLIADVDSISVRYLGKSPTLFGKENNWQGELSFYRPFVNFCETADKNRVSLDYPIGGFFENTEYFMENPSKPNLFYSVDPTSKTYMEANYYLVAYKVGYYGNMGDSVQRIQAYAAENNIPLDGPVYINYLIDEVGEVDRSKYMAQIICTIAPDALDQCVRELNANGKLRDNWHIECDVERV